MNKRDVEAVASEFDPVYADRHETPRKRLIRERARAAIIAYEASLAERGLAVRPREPTEKMVLAGKYQRECSRLSWIWMHDAFKGEPDG